MAPDAGAAGTDPGSAPVSSGTGPGFHLGRRNIYILPSGQGLAFCAVLVVTLIGATNYNNSLAFTFTFLLASLGLVSMLHTYRNLAGLGIQLRAGEPVSAGDEARFQIRVVNPGPRPRPGIEFSQGPRRRAARTRAGTATRTAITLSVAAEDIAHASLPVPALRRGWLWPQRAQVSTRVPLGLFRAWVPVTSDTPCLVYPRPAGTQPMPSTRLAGSQATPSRSAGEDDFAGLRSYRPGDPPRRIHWRAASRGGIPPVKEFDADGGEEQVFRFDDVIVQEQEDRLCQLAAWVHEAHRQGLRFGLELPTALIPPQAGPAQLHRCLGALATHGLDTNAAHSSRAQS